MVTMLILGVEDNHYIYIYSLITDLINEPTNANLAANERVKGRKILETPEVSNFHGNSAGRNLTYLIIEYHHQNNMKVASSDSGV